MLNKTSKKTSKPVEQTATPKLSLCVKLELNRYRSKLEWGTTEEEHAACRADESRLEEEFKTDLFEELEIVGNPKADKLYSIAYQMGHSGGYSEVYSYAQDMVELIK